MIQFSRTYVSNGLVKNHQLYSRPWNKDPMPFVAQLVVFFLRQDDILAVGTTPLNYTQWCKRAHGKVVRAVSGECCGFGAGGSWYKLLMDGSEIPEANQQPKLDV